MVKHILGDSIAVLKSLPDKSIDMVLTDLPYGTTQCKWDSLIDLESMWAELNRVRRDPKVPMVFTSAQPFTSALIMSNPRHFKYEIIWEKSKATGYLNAKKQFMRAHENILVFYEKQCDYYPQMRQGDPYSKGTAHRPTDVYGSQVATTVQSTTGLRYPRSVVYFKTAEAEGPVVHPTQKPLALLEYLIRTYTKEGQTVLDVTSGSGSTLVACVRTKRDGIGIELDPKYHAIALERIKEA